ncbi:hypothetical protein ACQRIT_002371 [Beauveria bassiana]
MIALAQLLSPAPGQGSSDVTPATREVCDIRANQGPRTLNEQQRRMQQHCRTSQRKLRASTSEQPQSDKPVAKQTIHYNGQKWEYKGYKWLEAGILSLELKLVASNGGTELVREIDLHRDNPEGLLGLWKATCRPEPSSEKYEPLQVVEKTEDGRYRMQWTGFDALENTSLEPPWRIRNRPRVVERVPEQANRIPSKTPSQDYYAGYQGSQAAEATASTASIEPEKN